MKTFMTLSMLMITSLCYSQPEYEITNLLKDSTSTTLKYCQIVGTSKGLGISGKLMINIDFGQEEKILSTRKDYYLFDEKTGKPKEFNSMIDALNFMVDHGWEFVYPYAITMGNQNVYHYILRRPIK